MSLHTYSPSQVNISIAGTYFIDGFSENSIVSIVKDEQPFQYQKAIDGSIARLHKKDRTYTVSISLAQTSPSNNVLTSIFKVDEATGLGKFPILVKDNSGTSLFFATNCWIETTPPLSLSTSIETRDWTIKCVNGFMVVGGNDISLLEGLANAGGFVTEIASAVGIV